MESITDPEGWLSAGHTLDLTFLATASNFDTQTNGATHMGNDDILVFRETGHLKVIDVSCPVQLLEIMKWILEGGKGLVYLRIMRAASGTIHDDGFRFQYGKGYSVRQTLNPRAVIVSSGRGVHEAVAASDLLKGSGTDVDVIDMPSIDPDLICTIAEGSVPVLFAEQNNGFLWTSASRILLERGIHPGKGILNAVNTSGPEGTPRYIHSATYDELLDQFSLTPARLAERVNMLATENAHNNR